MTIIRQTVLLTAALLSLSARLLMGAESGWKPVEGHMMTRWAKDVSPANAWPEYPRPQMVRKDWHNLNGLWDYEIAPREQQAPRQYEGKILVPFCVESALSGVKKTLTPEQRLWYRRTFEVPSAWKGKRVLLHFGAVDWEANVSLNGTNVGSHKGGYTPFSIDITKALKPAGPQELVVGVWDPTDTGTQPRGKQVRNPEGIWYTSVSGIWQTVWLEPVAETSIERLQLEPDIDRGVLRLTVIPAGASAGLSVQAEAIDGSTSVSRMQGAAGQALTLRVDSPKLWSPDSPHLYGLKVTLLRGGSAVDTVESYFGMRKISLGKDRHGRTRLMLNNQPFFQLGPLDQGWWPDGLYTAPTDAALRYDIEMTRKLGFNLARKHVKVEPARWYYHADRLGMLVWQDMPNGHLHGNVPNNLRVSPSGPDAVRDPQSAAQFEAELKAVVQSFGNAPSIVMWVPFNEGWGQYDTARIAQVVKQMDPSRLVNCPSGWTDRGAGDVIDAHLYPGPGMERVEPNRATVLGEYGGLGWPVDGHLWWNKRNWGYRTYTSREDLNAKYREVTGNLWGLLARGLSAAVYTQTTDVEGEVNGLMTYDRAVTKFDPDELQKLHATLYRPAPGSRILLATSEHDPQQWGYSMTQPPSGWQAAGFDAAGWTRGPAPFQGGGQSLIPSGSTWTGARVWLRRTFDAERAPQNLWLETYNAVEKGTVYLNGKPVFSLDPQTATSRHYVHVDLSRHASLVRRGTNVVAIEGEAASQRRAIDVGLYTIQ